MSRKKLDPSGNQIQKWLIDMDMEKKELAKELNVSADYISQICHDKRDAKVMRARIKDYYYQNRMNQRETA